MKHKERCGLCKERNQLFRVFLGFLDKLSSFAPTSLDVTPKRQPVPVPVIPETAAAAAALVGVSLRLKKLKKKKKKIKVALG